MFAQGEIRFAASTGSYVAAAVTAVAIAAALVSYRGGARLTLRDRLVLATLRLAMLLLILVCLFRAAAGGPGRGAAAELLGVLLDDSRSMQIADVDGQPRASFVKASSAPPIAGLLKALSDRFTVRTFRFSSAATRTTQGGDLTFGGSQIAPRRGAVAACGRSWPACRSPGW